LWNGKSSHVDLTLSAGDFDLSILEDSVADRDLFFQSLKVLDEFAPAHAILKTKILISDNENATVSSVICSKIEKDLTASNSVSGETSIGDGGDTWNLDSNLGGGSDDGVNMSALGNIFKRADVANYGSPAFTTSGMVGAAPVPFGNEGIGRNSRRRRNYAHTLPKSGSQLYLRDGASMPIILNPSDTGKDNYLGYIPSSGRYLSASAYNNLPALYGRGENLNSPHTYYGVDVSNTYPCRGTSSLVASSCHPYSVRGETPLIWVIMNELMRAKNLQRAGKQYEINSDYYYLSSWMDVSGSLANSYNYPESIEDYENFEFGSDLHTLFNVWKDYYPDMSLRNFISFIFEYFKNLESSSPLFNGDFELPGSAISIMPPNTIASEAGDPNQDDSLWLDKTNLFMVGAEASGTYLLTSGIDTPYLSEYSNSSLLSGITITAAQSVPQIDAPVMAPVHVEIKTCPVKLYKVQDYPPPPYDENNYIIDKTFLVVPGGSNFSYQQQPKFIFNSSKLKFDLKSIFDLNPEYLYNLGPERSYKIKVKFSFLNSQVHGAEGGNSFFCAKLAVRTEYDTATSSFWYCDTPEDLGTISDNSGLTILNYDSQIWRKYECTSLGAIAKLEKDFLTSQYDFNGIASRMYVMRMWDYLMGTYDIPLRHNTIRSLLDESQMHEAELIFNTYNRTDNVDLNNNNGNGIHSSNTNYIIEISPAVYKYNTIYNNLSDDTIPALVIEQVSITDMDSEMQTNLINNYTVPNFGTGEDETYTEKIDLTPNQILRIFQFWNNVSTSVLQSRIGGPGYTGPQGGSRLNYRMHPEWYNNTKGASNQYTKINIK